MRVVYIASAREKFCNTNRINYCGVCGLCIRLRWIQLGYILTIYDLNCEGAIISVSEKKRNSARANFYIYAAAWDVEEHAYSNESWYRVCCDVFDERRVYYNMVEKKLLLISINIDGKDYRIITRWLWILNGSLVLESRLSSSRLF